METNMEMKLIAHEAADQRCSEQCGCGPSCTCGDSCSCKSCDGAND